ncbi:hypothetical protein AADZ91_13135 [Colwelliaceae bacterium 6441]
MHYHHIGIQSVDQTQQQKHIAALGMSISDYRNNPYGIAWLRFDTDSNLPEVIKNTSYIAFVVDDLAQAIGDHKVLVQPNELNSLTNVSDNTLSAFIEVDDAPIQLIQRNESVTSEMEQFSDLKGYHSYWIPHQNERSNESHLAELKMYVDNPENEFKIGWVKYQADAPYHNTVKQFPHLAFEVDNIEEKVAGQTIIIEPNSPTAGLIVGFIEICGAPVEFIQVDRNILKDGI